MKAKPKSKPKSKPKLKKVATKPKIKKKVVLGKKPAGYGKLVGSVKHYFDHINVAVIKLSQPLNVGDQIRIVGGQATDFNQTVASMQIDHSGVKKAKKGHVIGMKVKEKVREGYKVYKV